VPDEERPVAPTEDHAAVPDGERPVSLDEEPVTAVDEQPGAPDGEAAVLPDGRQAAVSDDARGEGDAAPGAASGPASDGDRAATTGGVTLAERSTEPAGDLTPPDESRLEESQQLINEAKKIAHDLREEVPDTTPEPPREEGSPAN
jgi:hypothetical protein